MNYELRIRKIKQLLPLVLLISMAIVERLWLDLGPNVELVTLVTILAGIYLGGFSGLWVGVGSLAISDMFLGNTNISLFTWSAYAVTGLTTLVIRKKAKTSLTRIGWGVGGGLLSNIWFYLWTNFGVWLLDGWGMYPDTFFGLVQSYINGLPFLKLQLIGNLLILPLGFGVIETVSALKLYKILKFSPLHGRLRI